MIDLNNKKVEYTIVYSSKNYHVVLLPEPLYNPEGDNPPMSYGLFNRFTSIIESFSTYLPGAIQAAESLSAKQEELMPTKEDNVIELLRPSGEIIEITP